MGIFFALLDLWRGWSTDGFSAQRPVMRSLDVFFDQHFELSKQSKQWWFETSSHSWRHCNDVRLRHTWPRISDIIGRGKLKKMGSKDNDHRQIFQNHFGYWSVSNKVLLIRFHSNIIQSVRKNIEIFSLIGRVNDDLITIDIRTTTICSKSMCSQPIAKSRSMLVKCQYVM